MYRHWYDLVNANGDLVAELITGYTNRDKQEYYDEFIAGEVLASFSKVRGERVFVATWHPEDI